MIDTIEFIKGFDFHTIIVVGIAFWWIHCDMQEMKSEIQMIKTILITKGIMPECYAKDVKPVDNSPK